jgi:hypothetical protein
VIAVWMTLNDFNCRMDFPADQSCGPWPAARFVRDYNGTACRLPQPGARCWPN